MPSHHKEENQHNPIEFISFSIKSLKDHHIAVIIASFIIYFAGFGILYALTKTTVGGFFALLPVMAIAWSFGIIGGLSGAKLERRKASTPRKKSSLRPAFLQP